MYAGHPDVLCLLFVPGFMVWLERINLTISAIVKYTVSFNFYTLQKLLSSAYIILRLSYDS